MSLSRDRFPKSEKILSRPMHGRAALALFALASLCCMAVNIADPDLWGHVQFGRDVLRDGFIHPTTTYSFTAEGFRWINHENLSEILLALTYDNLGIAGLIAGKFLLATFLFFVIVHCALKNGVDGLVAGLTVFLVAINLSLHWHFRPQIASFVFCALMLWNLEYCFRGWHESLTDPTNGSMVEGSQQLRWLWLMPIILFLWANSHGGFVAGICILLAYLGGRSIEAIYYRRSDAYGLVFRLALMGFVGGLATFINPYGPDLHLWLAQSLGEPRPEIRDWHPIVLSSTSGTRFLVVAVVAGISLAVSKRRRDWTQILILTLVCWQAWSHVRHVAFFVLLFGFWVPGHLQSLLVQLKQRISSNSLADSGETTATPAWLKISCVSVACLLAGVCFFRSTDLPVDKSFYPVEAFEYIADQDLSGRMVVTYNWAQYAIGAFGGEYHGLPICPVAFDGRFRTCYPQQIVDMHFDFVIGDQGPGSRNRGSESGPPNETWVLEFGQPELVLISRRQRPSVDVMNGQNERWSLLYQDQLAQVWGRKDIFDNSDSPRFIPKSQRAISDLAQSGTATWPAIPTNFKNNRVNPIAVDRIAGRITKL